MPKATIVSETGLGEYVIQLEYDLTRALERKDTIIFQIAEVEKVIVTLQGILTTKEATRDAAEVKLDATVSAIPAGQEISDEDRALVKADQKALLLAATEVKDAEAAIQSDQYFVAQLGAEQKQINAALSKYENPVPVEAWCIDHTLKLEGEVGTVELQDETNSPHDQPTLIHADGTIKDDKVVQPVISSGSSAIAYNSASMPAFQKWKPMYRNGKITNINTTLNLATVAFNETNEFSSIRGYSFNQAYSIFRDVSLNNVPVVYMDCHAKAFHENDAVVVEFVAGEVAPGEINPTYDATIIGFVSNPFLCPINIYLESGFLDLISVGRCTEGAFLPAKLHFDTDTASYNSSLTRPMQLKTDLIPSDFTEDSPYFGQVPAEGQDSLAVGCLPSEQLSEITDFCLNTHTNGGYCDDAILVKKQAQMVIPASMFSGKLRLFVQSLYGSLNNTYEKLNNFDLKISYPKEEDQEMYAPVTLVRGFQGSSFLYTTDNYDYFLFTYNGGQFTVFPLDLSQQGRTFRDHLLTSARIGEFDYVKKVEALILSTAKINTGNSAAVTVVGDPILGSPVDYGWHADWKGENIACVTFFDDPLNPQYLSTQQKIKITETINPIDGAVSFALVNTPASVDSPWWPWTNGLHVFYYDEEEQSMVPVEYPAILFGGFEGTFDAPIYNYYVFDETSGVSSLKTVNIHMDLSIPPNVNFDIIPDKAYSNSSGVIVDKKVYNGISGTKGFRIGGVSIELETKQLSSSEDTTVTLNYETGLSSISGLFFGRLGDANQISDHPTIKSPLDFIASEGHSVGDTREVDGSTQHLCFMHYHFVWRTDKIVESSGSSTSGSLFVQTVLGDCSTFISGKSETTAHGGQSLSAATHIDKALSGKLYWSEQSPFTNLSPEVTETIGEMPGPNYVHRLGTYTDNINPGPFTSSTIPADSGTTAMELFEYNDGNANPVTIADDSRLDEYFSPTISDKPTHTVDTGRRSIGNKFKMDHAAFGTDGDFIQDSSVGWS